MADFSIDDSGATMATANPITTASALNDEEFEQQEQPSPPPPSTPSTPSTPEHHAHDTGAMPVVVVEPTEDGSGSVAVSEWMQCVNEHGETYFYNVYTGETCWQLPVQTEALVDDVGEVVDRSHHVSSSTAGGDDAGIFERGSLPDCQVEDSTTIDAAQPTAHTQRRSFQLVRQVMDGSIKRLDRNVQMQLEEARRRQRELEELRDGQVRLGGERWAEMYDPTHDCFYYYDMFSGDMRWEKPDSYVMKAESDAILRIVVKLQCAFRMTLARKRVFQMKLLAAEQQRQHGLLRKQQVLETEVFAALDDANADNVWVEVYDPFHKVVYYYCSITGETRWDPPAFFISANEDKEMAAAIAIQALSRSFLARRDVKQRKTTLRKKRQEQAMDEAHRLRELRHREFLSKSEDERSSICRREMIEEEMEQIRSGDWFWGIDAHDHEVRRQQTEERLMATAEVFWQHVNFTMKMRGELHQHKTKEQELKRKEHETMAEANARDTMSLEEALQRRLHDNFWGIQGEEQRETRARRDMADEELLSHCFGQELHVRDLHFVWKDEAEIKSVRDARNKVVNEKRYQKHYLKWFYQNCTSVDDLLDYLWPTMQRFVPKSTAKKKKKSLNGDDDLEQYYNSRSLGSSYILDDLVVKERLERGDLRYGNKSVFTIHHPNSAQILGRKGGFSMEKVVQTKAVFEQTAAIRQPVPTSPSRPMPPRVKMTPKEEEHLRMGMSVHYKRSKISPTREILCSSHRKLNQLPSFSASSKLSSKSSSKKTKQQHKFDLWTNNNNSPRSNSFMQQHLTKFGHPTVNSMATTFGFAGPYAIEDKAQQRRGLGDGEHDNDDDAEKRDHFDGEDDDGESDDVGDQRQHQLRLEAFARRFAVEEHDVLLRVFSMMDYDGSGAVNKQEMTWALQRDEEVSALASKSMLLRVFLKQHTHLDELFSHLERSGGGQGGGQYRPALVDTLDHNKNKRKQSEELSCQVFIVFCEQMYINLMDQGLLPLLGQEREAYNSQLDGPQHKKSQHQHHQSEAPENEDPNAYREDEEERKIRNLFAILDNDANGVLEVEELQHALYDTSNDEISELVRSSKALQPLLHEEMFMNAFRKFETEDPCGISEEEFVGFCLEIASIAMLNGML